MEGRARKCVQGSPEMSAPPPKNHHQRHHPPPQGRKVPVVYYLCRNRHLEHPHFIEVPAPAQEGLYLRDVISRLNALRGKGMAAMYSWSFKRSYKNGFVRHDLSEDDPILPSNGNEYVLKGSELLDSSPSDRLLHDAAAWSHASKQQDNPLITSRSPEMKTPCQALQLPPPPTTAPVVAPEDEFEHSPSLRRRSSSSRTVSPDCRSNPPWSGGGGGGGSSPRPLDHQLFKANGATDASTQTEDGGGRSGRAAGSVADGPSGTRSAGVSTDEGPLDLDFEEGRRALPSRKESSETSAGEVSPPPTTSSTPSSVGKTETFESLIRADARKKNQFMIPEEEEVLAPAGGKLRAANVLMQLITCGSISVKDHRSFGIVPTYKPRFSQVKPPSPVFSSSRAAAELDCLLENPRLAGLSLEEKEYFSGSLIETKAFREAEGRLVPTLKRSSSYNAERSCKMTDLTATDGGKPVDSAGSGCLPRTIKTASTRQPKNDASTKSPACDGPRISSAETDRNHQLTPQCCSSRGGSRRFTEASAVAGSSTRLESFREEKEKIIKIEESLLRELGL